MTPTISFRLPVLVALALVAAACASDGDASTSATANSTDSVAAAPEPTPEPAVASTDASAEPIGTATTEPTTADTAGSTVAEPAPNDTAAPTTDPDPASPWLDDEFPDQPAGVPWPTAAWPVGELPAGIDAGAIDRAVETAFGADDAQARLRSLLVVHGGRLVYERYHPLDGPDTVVPSFSVAKSVTSTVVGMLVDDGLLDVDAPAPVAAWQGADDPRAAITLDDLLTMSSGLEWEEQYDPGSIAGMMFASPDWAAFVAERPLEAEPGTFFEYSTGTTALLADIAADALGGADELTAYIETELMAPLGITSTELALDPTGQFAGGLGFDSSARDFARFGYLVLRGGWWDGEPVVSADWIEAASSPSAAQPDYGYQWWLSGDGRWIEARGLFGQLVRVVPELDLVVVATATNGGDSFTPMSVAYAEFAELAGER